MRALHLHGPRAPLVVLGSMLALCWSACGSDPPRCVLGETAAPAFSERIGCQRDFESLASAPLSESIPGARSVKTSIDREADWAVSFQNTSRFPRHWDFLSEHRSVAAELPLVPSLSEFNTFEYTSPSRRFVLGAISHYAGANQWVYEVAPYDAADANMIADAMQRLSDRCFFGSRLKFHPTSQAVGAIAEALPGSIPVVSSEELLSGSAYQPLNLASSVGRLHFVRSDALETEPVSFRDIVVLDSVPTDISATAGIVTSTYQTPLSHINVLAKNRSTPNMALTGAFDATEWRALEGQWVRLTVGSSDYELTEATEAEADAWWEEHRPEAVAVPGLNESITELTDIEQLAPLDSTSMYDAIKAATRAFGGKAAHYSVLAQEPALPVPKAFAIPVYHYRKFFQDNGFVERVQALLSDSSFQADPLYREAALDTLRDDIRVAPVDPDFEAALFAKIEGDYPGTRLRFRSSTNAEDLAGFTGAGLYSSRTGDPNDPSRPVLDAVRRVWSSVWRFRAFEERSYRSIDHLAVGMAVLVHRSFPDEEANGVALTGNPFDTTNGDPAFYVNVQVGENSVVEPEPGVQSEQYLHYYLSPGQPVSYLTASNLVTDRVLSSSQVTDLSQALERIQALFSPAYAQQDWWAMDVEFKFDAAPGETPALFIKQARPFGGR